MSASWTDYDNDGWLDVYVTNYARCLGEQAGTSNVPGGLKYQPRQTVPDNHDGTFSDVTALLEGDPATTADGATTAPASTRPGSTTTAMGVWTCTLRTTTSAGPDHNQLWRNAGPAQPEVALQGRVEHPGRRT